MSSVVESGPLRGRPFGGLMCLISNDLREITETIYCSERLAVVRISNFLIVNAYFPRAGTTNRQLICDDLLADVGIWCDQYFPSCNIILAGDLNVNLDSSNHVSAAVNSFLARYSLIRGDDLFPVAKVPTYINEALNQSSMIDYILTSSPHLLIDFTVTDPDSNFSDHLPVMGTFCCSAPPSYSSDHTSNAHNSQTQVNSLSFRWDKGDILSYYLHTGVLLHPVLERLEYIIQNQANLPTADILLSIESYIMRQSTL